MSEPISSPIAREIHSVETVKFAKTSDGRSKLANTTKASTIDAHGVSKLQEDSLLQGTIGTPRDIERINASK